MVNTNLFSINGIFPRMFSRILLDYMRSIQSSTFYSRRHPQGGRGESASLPRLEGCVIGCVLSFLTKAIFFGRRLKLNVQATFAKKLQTQKSALCPLQTAFKTNTLLAVEQIASDTVDKSYSESGF